MIYFVSCPQQCRTHETIWRATHLFRPISYPHLFARRRAPKGAYIFVDFDRLSFWQLELAAIAYRRLEVEGCPVYNDPARALTRLAMLEKLFEEGVNSFRAWRAADVQKVDRFPCFIRTAAAHRGVLSELIHDRDALSRELSGLIDKGYPHSDLIIVEYRAAPEASGVFRKRSAYRIGDNIIPETSVFERNWSAKHGHLGAGGDDGYASDLADIRANRFAAEIMQAFELAAIDYGRADFGLVDGRVEIYEINTNPSIGPIKPHPFADRQSATQHCRSALIDAIGSLNVDLRGNVALDFDEARPGRARRDKLLPGYLWTP